MGNDCYRGQDFIWGDKNVLKFTVVMVTQLGEYIKTTDLCFLDELTICYVNYSSMLSIYVFK